MKSSYLDGVFFFNTEVHPKHSWVLNRSPGVGGERRSKGSRSKVLKSVSPTSNGLESQFTFATISR